MQIKAKKEDLLKPLLKAGNVVERRQTLPILANVLIAAHHDKLTFTATDLEVEITTHSAGQCSEEIEFTLPARKLTDICKALPDGVDVSLTLEGDKATLRSGRGRYTIGVLPARDYPNIAPPGGNEAFTIPESVFKRLIDKTAFAMAHQDVRYYLNGLLFEVRPGRVRTVATDGHRLALCDANIEVDAVTDVQVILPRKAVLELGRLLTDVDDPVRIEVSNSHMRVLTLDTVFTTKLVDGRFPDYERVIPAGDAQLLQMDREALKQALTRTSILSNEKYRGIRFRVSKGLLHLQAHNPEQDEAEEEIEVEFAGEEITIGFNVGYLLDVMSVIDTETVQMALFDSNSSTLITPDSGDGVESSRYVIMPMRL